MQKQLEIPTDRCPVLNACSDETRPAWRTVEEWRALYPMCAREQAGIAHECPHLERVRARLNAQQQPALPIKGEHDGSNPEQHPE